MVNPKTGTAGRSAVDPRRSKPSLQDVLEAADDQSDRLVLADAQGPRQDAGDDHASASGEPEQAASTDDRSRTTAGQVERRRREKTTEDRQPFLQSDRSR